MTYSGVSSSGRRLTLMGMISEYGRIEIPLIQRDYAHGRQSATTVRNRFLDGLLGALAENRLLSLDFVYGESGDSFTPIDGQQRLTTLFFLHWMLALSANRLPEFQARMLDQAGRPRFLYATRPAPSRFFELLLHIQGLKPDESVPDQIQDSHLFFHSWRQDPTVMSGLVVLGDIQERIQSNPNAGNLYSRLIGEDSASVTVDTLDLGSLGLSDEIYVKMNARGKELTGFEKLKAWLVERHPELRWPNNQEDQGQWPVLMDGDWLDLFWAFHHDQENPAESAGIAYFRTLIALATNFHASEGRFESAWESAIDASDEALWEALFTDKCMVFMFECLSRLSERETEVLRIVELRNRVLKFLRLSDEPRYAPFLVLINDTSSKATFLERLWLHALCRCLLRIAPGDDNLHNHWFRVIRNLVSNNKLDADKYKSLIHSIDSLSTIASENHAGDVLCALLDEQLRIHGADGFQLNQERAKASLMRQTEDGAEWEDALILAESHAMLNGDLDLILTDGCMLEDFRSRWACFSSMLDKSGSRIGQPGEWLLARAVLAKVGDINLPHRGRFNLKDDFNSWVELVNAGSAREEVLKIVKDNIRHGFLLLIDEVRDQRDLVGALQGVIDGFHGRGFWVADLVLYAPALLTSSTSKKIQHYSGEGVYVYHKTNAAAADVLLGPAAWLRNTLINRMRTAVNGAWHLDSDDRAVEVSVSEDAAPVIVYAGHAIRLISQQEDINAKVDCWLYPGSLELNAGSAEEWESSSVEYPPSFQLHELAALLREKLSEGDFRAGSPLGCALAQLCSLAEGPV